MNSKTAKLLSKFADKWLKEEGKKRGVVVSPANAKKVRNDLKKHWVASNKRTRTSVRREIIRMMEG